MTINERLVTIFSALLSVLNGFTVLVICWACYRGFDFSDESYYFLGYLYYENTPDLSGASFHLLFNRFFSSFDLSLTEVRLLRVVLTLIASLMLYFGFKKMIFFKTKAEQLVLFNVALGGMLLSYTWAPLALSYNSMSSIAIAFIIGIWLMALDSFKVYQKLIYATMLGALFALLFFVKITNIILFPLLGIATLYQFHKNNALKNLKVKSVLLHSGGFLIGAICILIFLSKGLITVPQTIDQHIKESFGVINNDSSHAIGYLWKRYYDNAEMVIQKLKYPILLLFVCFGALNIYSLKKGDNNKFIGQTFFKIVGIVILMIIVYQNQYWKGGSSGFKYIMLIPYIFIGVFTFLNLYMENKKVNLVLILALLCIPISGAVGTNNGLSAQVLFYGIFIFFIIFYLVRSSKKSWYKFTMLTITMVLGTSQVVSATIIYPYRQAVPTNSNRELEGIDTLEDLMVDQPIFQLKQELSFLENVKAEYVFAYSGVRGMALLANKKPYSLEWFRENMVQKTCLIINKSKIEPENIIFLLDAGSPLTKEVVTCLENNGISLKTGYSKAKQISFFDEGSKKVVEVAIYIPKADKNRLKE